jgi:hypothetical protein
MNRKRPIGSLFCLVLQIEIKRKSKLTWLNPSKEEIYRRLSLITKSVPNQAININGAESEALFPMK